MKIKQLLALLTVTSSFSAFAQFFDSVPYRGAFGVTGTTKPSVTGYNPDPTNTSADWTKPWANWNPVNTSYPGDAGWTPTTQFPATNANKVTVSGDISSDVTWTKNNWYELSGTVHVLSGATLTIEPGTVIRGSVSNIGVLIIAKGGKLNAIGTKDQPIVITSGKAPGSRVRGDWGGLLLIGNAHTNTPGGKRQYEALPSDPLAEYGGGATPNDADNSGTLRYMRVEFGGYNYLPDQEINGLTLAGVGYGTKIDYIQVSFANDDSYEWFGGAVNHKYLIAFAGTDDDFDMDEGYNGKCQYLLGVRNPAIFETSPTGTSNGLEHDNNTGLGTATQVTPGITAPEPRTAPVISNLTLVGPIKPGASRSTLSSTAQSRYGRGFETRTNTSTSVFNSIILGYPTLWQLGNPNNTLTPSVQTRLASDEMTMRNLVFVGGNSPDVRFNSTNPPTTFNGNPFTFTMSDMRNIIMNGPTSGVTGPTGTDTARTTLTAGTELTNPIYGGNSNGSLSQLDFTVVDYTLSVGSPFAANSNFSHPKIATIPQPTVAINPTSLAMFNQVIGQPLQIKWFLVQASNLAGNVTIAAPADFQVSFSRTTGWNSSINKNGPSLNDTVFVRFNRNVIGSSSGVVNVASSVGADFAPINILVSGNAVLPASPYVNASESMLSFSTSVGTPSNAMMMMVGGRYLQDSVSISASSNFEVSLNGTSFSSAVAFNKPVMPMAGSQLFVRYNPSAASASHTGFVRISSKSADTVNVSLSGNSAATLTSSPAQLPEFVQITGAPSLAVPFNISGVRLTDTVKVTVPTPFQISTDSAFTNPVTSLNLNVPATATLNNVKLFVRYNPTAAASNSGSISISSTGATTRTITIAGRALAAGTRFVSVYSPAYTLFFETIFTSPAVPSASQAFVVSGVNLGSDSLVVTAPTSFEVSLDNNTFVPVIRIPNTSGAVSPTVIFTRYNPVSQSALNQQLYVNASSTASSTTSSATNIIMFLNGNSAPLLNSSSASLQKMYTTTGKRSMPVSFTVNGKRLVDSVAITATTGFMVSIDSINYSQQVKLAKSGTTLADRKVFVVFMGNTAGATNGNISLSTTNGASIPVAVSGVGINPPAPTVNISTSVLAPFATSVPGPTAARSFTFDASDLVDSLTISVGGNFELSPDSVVYKKVWKLAADMNGKIAPFKLFCRYNRANAGNDNDTIRFNSLNLLQGKVAVSGTNYTGVASTEKDLSHMVLYPNPVANAFYLAGNNSTAADLSVELYDLSGRKLKEIAFGKQAMGAFELEVNTSDLQNGFYLVKIVSDENTTTKRILINK